MDNSTKIMKTKPDLQALRRAIPAHCFERSYTKSLLYIFRDFCLAGSCAWVAYHFIPLIENSLLRATAWALYGWFQGLVYTGIWVLGHELGHYALFPSAGMNDFFGFITHSVCLTPYYSFKSTHRRHHIYANHMEKDLHYIPPRRKRYIDGLRRKFHDLDELTEDTPFFTLFRLTMRQLFGWPCYLLLNSTAPPTCGIRPPSKRLFGNSHFAPFGTLFTSQEAHEILLSDIGILGVISLLWYGGTQLGSQNMLLLYLQPYLWMNHMITAVTYLQHTDPEVPKYEAEAWTYVKGATATMDRDFGFVGRHLLHGVTDYHVIHHLFTRIPFYHAEEATKAVIPHLGDAYRSKKGRDFYAGFKGFYAGLWETFNNCKWVEPDNPSAKPEDRAMVYRYSLVPTKTQ